jgi:hypothetical protein
MMKILLILLISGQTYNQNTWDLLATTTIKQGHDSFLNEAIDLPIFSEQLRKWNGKEITLEGYIIPLQQGGSQGYFVLSRFPYQSCFFCGAAGPETVVEVYSSRKVQFTDERVHVQGILELNENDPLHLFFLLRNCTVVSL